MALVGLGLVWPPTATSLPQTVAGVDHSVGMLGTDFQMLEYFRMASPELHRNA
jgi:hypothetical protein